MSGSARSPSAVGAGVAPARLRYPNFIVIGAQKAGTSWLHENLSVHPELWLPPVKEVHYFDRIYLEEHARERAARRTRDEPPPRNADPDVAATARHRGEMQFFGPLSDEWYGVLFAQAPETSLCGEITPAYAVLPPAGVDHLLRLAPEVKILFVVRDPVDRVVSQIRMGRRSAGAPRWASPAPGGAIDPALLARSMYSTTLRTYGERVDPAQMWIGDFDELCAEPASFLEGVCRFLGVSFDASAFVDLDRRFNAAPASADDGPPIEAEVLEALETALAPEYEALAKILPEPVLRWRKAA